MSTAILSFLGVIIGAALQYCFTRHLDNQKHHRELRTKSYTDYLRAVLDQANLRPQPQSQEGKEVFSRAAYAKCRIFLYGSAKVISAFARFEKPGATMNTPEQCAAFGQMVALMRSDSAQREKSEAKI